MPSFAESHDGFVLPNARFNPSAQPPSCSGLLTPPESPKSSKTTLPMPISSQCAAPMQNDQLPQYHDSPQSFRFDLSEPEPKSAQHDLSRVSETIYAIIEQVIEQKLAEAMGPLRLNVRRLDSESLEFHEQNDTLGSQVGHLEQQLHNLQNISVTTSNNLKLLSSVANQLSTATNLMQKANGLATAPDFPTFASSPASRQRDHHDIQPQFCFKSRSSRNYRHYQSKSTKPGLVHYMLSKWRTEGSRD